MSLPLPWVDRLFEKLTITYGRDFLDRWRDIDLNLVKHDWAHELGGLETAPECIAHALNHLPAKPPTVLEFRTLALQAPRATKALPPPSATPEVIAKAMQRLNEPRQSYDHKAWARRLKARHESGDKLGAIQIIFYREALREPA